MEFVAKKGWLQKEGHVVKNWKKRYFALAGPLLVYFAEPAQDPKQMGQGLKGKITVSDAKLSTPPDAKFPNLIQIVPTDGKTLLVSAETPAERDEWLAALQKAARGEFE